MQLRTVKAAPADETLAYLGHHDRIDRASDASLDVLSFETRKSAGNRLVFLRLGFALTTGRQCEERRKERPYRMVYLCRGWLIESVVIEWDDL